MAVTNRSYNRHCNGDLRDDPTLLEKVRHDARADHLAARVELHVHELAKPARVVVTDLCAPCACGRVRAVCVRVCVRTVLALPNASRIADVLMNRLRSAPSLPVGHMPSAGCRAAARSHSLRRARRVRHTRHRRLSAMLSGRWGAGRGEGEGGGGSCHRPRHGWHSWQEAAGHTQPPRLGRCGASLRKAADRSRHVRSRVVGTHVGVLCRPRSAHCHHTPPVQARSSTCAPARGSGNAKSSNPPPSRPPRLVSPAHTHTHTHPRTRTPFPPGALK